MTKGLPPFRFWVQTELSWPGCRRSLASASQYVTRRRKDIRNSKFIFAIICECEAVSEDRRSCPTASAPCVVHTCFCWSRFASLCIVNNLTRFRKRAGRTSHNRCVIRKHRTSYVALQVHFFFSTSLLVIMLKDTNEANRRNICSQSA